MKIMVEISKEDYEGLKRKDKFNNMHLNYYEKLIVNGTPIPRGCGHLIDADKVISKICGSKCGCHLEECGYDKPCYPVEIIKSASTIIEASYSGEAGGKAIVIEPKDNTVGSSLSSIIDTYVKVSEENGLPVNKIVVNNGLVYWDNEETLNKWEAEEEG